MFEWCFFLLDSEKQLEVVALKFSVVINMRGYRRFRKYGPRAFPVQRQIELEDVKRDDVGENSMDMESPNLVVSTNAIDSSVESGQHDSETNSARSSVSKHAAHTDPVQKLRDCVPDDQWVYTTPSSHNMMIDSENLDIYPPAMVKQIRFLNSFSRKRKHSEL